VAKLRSDYPAKALAATDVDSKTLRRACKLVAKNAHGAIVFLLRKTVLPDAIFTQLNNDDNGGDDNGGDDNDER
jgi:hypothetical protein